MSYDEFNRLVKRQGDELVKDLESLPTTADQEAYWMAMEWDMCRLNSYYWMTTYAQTWDPDAPEGEELKLFPDRRFLWKLCKLVQENRVLELDILKPRRMFITWWGCGWFTWDGMFHSARNTIFHTMDEGMAGFGGGGEGQEMHECMLGRVLHIYQHLPEWQRRRCPATPSRSPRHRLTFHVWDEKREQFINSVITAMPNIPALLARSQTLTGFLTDEVPHQTKPAAARQGVRSTVLRGNQGRIIGPGTPPPDQTEAKTWFGQQIHGTDRENAEWEELMPYSESAHGVALQAIMDDKTDHIIGPRMEARRKASKSISMHLYFSSDWKRGKQYDQDRRDEHKEDYAAYRQEHWGDMFVVSKEKQISWVGTNDNFGHYTYDPAQPPPFDIFGRTVDPGGHSACVLCQKVKVITHPDFPDWRYEVPGHGYQVRIFGEANIYGLTKELGQGALDATKEAMERAGVTKPWKVPVEDFCDTAGNQTNRQTGKTDIEVLKEEYGKHYPEIEDRGIRNRIVHRKEGVNEVAQKLPEVLGYYPDGKPIMGLVIDTRCPVCCLIFRGSGILTPDLMVSKKAENERFEHHMNCCQYWFAMNVPLEHILKPADFLPKPEEKPLTREEIKENVKQAFKTRRSLQRKAWDHVRRIEQ